MDISDVHMIDVIIRTGSLSEACKQLNQSQPTLSRRLSRLEDNLKVQLFHRSARGLVPTDIATYIVSSAAPLNKQLKAIERHIELASNLNFGSVSIGVGPINQHLLMPDVLTRFAQMTGDIQVSVVIEDDQTLLTMFDNSDLDIIIGPFDEQEWAAKGIITEQLVGDPIIAVARYDHPVFQYETVTEEILARYHWAVPKTEGTVQRREDGVRLRAPKIVADSYELLRRVSIRLDTICAGPRAIFKKDIETRALREINVDLGLYWQSVLFVRPESIATPLVRQLVELCKDVSSGLRVESSVHRTNH